MPPAFTRRALLQSTVAAAVPALLPTSADASSPPGWVMGRMTGARALVETLLCEGASCVFGIPGAQGNELWDQMKSRGLPYLLVTHELSASFMADGAARATGRPGVVCVVPGPGITNALSGLGEALLDSIPIVAIVGDVARGDKYRPFQVHELPNAALLKPVSKCVITACRVEQIPGAVRQAFQLAVSGEPGPVSVVIPYNLLIEAAQIRSAPLPPCAVPFDEIAFAQALALLRDHKKRIGIYAGLGCMDHAPSLTCLAEILQAPVATSVSGKGVINECHPLAVGWGFGAQGTRTAEKAFKSVDVVLAIGVRFSEVSTGFYCLPQPKHVIHVDANKCNLGRVLKTDVCVHADAGVFLSHLLGEKECLQRPANRSLVASLQRSRQADAALHAKGHATCGVDPMTFILALRRASSADALVFVDVTQSEHWAAEAFTVTKPRTYFNPTDNQAMGWSIPAALGAARVCPGRQVVTITGDGCFLMSGMELSTAARECLPVKFFILDDQAYHYMQTLQKSAYRRTTATHLARLDYASLAKGFGVTHVEIRTSENLEAQLRGILALPGPVLTTIVTDYGTRKTRWIEAVRGRFTQELSAQQKVRFLARLGARSLAVHPQND